MHAFFAGLNSPLHISHRGGSALYPENTMVAFRGAVEQFHTDMLELDVHATRDGEVVVFHDATLDRCTDGQGPLVEQTWASLQTLDAAFHFQSLTGVSGRGQGVRIPKLTELLDAFPQVRLNVEVKAATAIDPFVRLMKQRPADLRRLCIGSEHDSIGELLVKALPEACHFFPANALASFVISAREGEPIDDDERFHVLDMPLEWQGVQVFDEQVVKAALLHHKWVNVWTVDDPTVMRQLVTMGVGGIMTDRPDLLRQVLGPPH